MRAAVLALVEGMLYPDIRGDLALCSLETYEPGDLERVTNLDLRRIPDKRGTIRVR